MTVRGAKYCEDTIEQDANKDILFKLIWQKPIRAGRRQLAHSASSSFPSHISRKLLLEEHKLNVRLEKIEKERRQFLQRNDSDKRLLRLAVRASGALEKRMNNGQFLVPSDDGRFQSTTSDFHDSLNEGNRKPRTSGTHEVFYQSGANSIRQLQIKKVCLLRKTAERKRMTNSLPWKRPYEAPKVPPPSRSPSKTNIIWVRVRNSSGEMEIDGFLRNKKEFEELMAKSKDNIVPTKIEIRVPREKDSTGCFDASSVWNTRIDGLKLEMNIGKVWEKQENKLESERSIESNRMDEQIKQTTQAVTVSDEVPFKQLAPTVKGLKTSSTKVPHNSNAQLNSEEREIVDEHDDCTKKSSTSRRSKRSDSSSNGFKDKPNAASTHTERDGGKSSRSTPPNDVNDRSNVKCSQANRENARENIGCVTPDTVGGRSNIGSGRSKLRRTWSLILGGRKDTGSARKNVCCSREKIRKKWKQSGVERNSPTGGTNVKESKTKRSRPKFAKSSPAKVADKVESEKTTLEGKPGLGEIRIHAKAFVITPEAKERPGHKGTLQDKKSSTKPPKPPKKSCSACTVTTSPNDVSLRVVTNDIRSKSDTAACSKVREAIGRQERARGTGSPDRLSHSPAPISLPSKTQMQDFDKVARIKLRQTLAVKMRRHCYTGTWAFPPHAALVGQ